ncbi:MAG: DNA polymerase III subunit chi [Pseudomonadota bacterium]
MSRVDFYILSDTNAAAREQFACRLVAKAAGLSHRVHILLDDESTLSELDALLWTFSDDSFVAHDRWPDDDITASVTLGLSKDGIPSGAEVCVNLSSALAPGDCARIAEIVAADDSARVAGRQRFAEYRDRSAEMNTFKL